MELSDTTQDAPTRVIIKALNRENAMHTRTVATSYDFGLAEVEEEISDAFTQNSFIVLPVVSTEALGGVSHLYLNIQDLVSIEVIAV